MNTDPDAQGGRLDELLRTFPGGGSALAARAGVGESQVSRWRTGRARLSWTKAEQIAPVLGVSPGFLYAGLEGWVPPHMANGRDDVPWDERRVPAAAPEGVAPSGHAPPLSAIEVLAGRVDDLAQRLERIEALLEVVAAADLAAAAAEREAGGSEDRNAG